MDRHPIDVRRRAFYESAIRGVDLFVYSLVVAAGAALIFLPFTAAVEQLRGFEALIVMWAILLIGGGVAGFIGRLTRFWMLEQPGNIASLFGAAIYVVILSISAASSLPAFFTLVFVVIATADILRRWLELQIFASPGGDWHLRLAEAVNRRTKNVVIRDRP